MTDTDNHQENEERSHKPSRELFKSFDLSKAYDEFAYESFGAKETSIAGAKLVGKSLFNLGKGLIKNAPQIVNSITEVTEKETAKLAKEAERRANNNQ